MANKRVVMDSIQKHMQADFDRGMKMSDIAKKYGIQYELVRKYVDNHKPAILESPKEYVIPDFGRKWNEVRYAPLWGSGLRGLMSGMQRGLGSWGCLSVNDGLLLVLASYVPGDDIGDHVAEHDQISGQDSKFVVGQAVGQLAG